MGESFVHTNVENGVYTICFYSSASNSLTSKQLQDITQEIYNASQDKAIRVVLLKSKGEQTFCAGASFDELLTIDTVAESVAFFKGFANVINAMLTSTKLIVTQVQGKTVGGGVGIIAASDVVFAHDSASVKLSELSIGIGPFVIEPIISHKIGKVNTSKLAYHPTQWKNAIWSENVGLYHYVINSQEALQMETQRYVHQMANYSEEALVALKQVLTEGNQELVSVINQRASLSGQLLLNDSTKNKLKNLKSK